LSRVSAVRSRASRMSIPSRPGAPFRGRLDSGGQQAPRRRGVLGAESSPGVPSGLAFAPPPNRPIQTADGARTGVWDLTLHATGQDRQAAHGRDILVGRRAGDALEAWLAGRRGRKGARMDHGDLRGPVVCLKAAWLPESGNRQSLRQVLRGRLREGRRLAQRPSAVHAYSHTGHWYWRSVAPLSRRDCARWGLCERPDRSASVGTPPSA
jgi:hypothetical protein